MNTADLDKSRAPATVTIKLDTADRARISALAQRKKRTPHYLMKEAILEYIGREEARQNFVQAALASSEHYQETGSHITMDEFSEWVDAVQQAPDSVMPPCHG
jgi:predicted transcriptional regulator